MDRAWAIRSWRVGLHPAIGAVKKGTLRYDPHTTNNRMELMAAIQGLLAFKEPCEVEITTDAEYVRQGITQWIDRWKRRTGGREPPGSQRRSLD